MRAVEGAEGERAGMGNCVGPSIGDGRSILEKLEVSGKNSQQTVELWLQWCNTVRSVCDLGLRIGTIYFGVDPKRRNS